VKVGAALSSVYCSALSFSDAGFGGACLQVRAKGQTMRRDTATRDNKRMVTTRFPLLLRERLRNRAEIHCSFCLVLAHVVGDTCT